MIRSDTDIEQDEHLLSQPRSDSINSLSRSSTNPNSSLSAPAFIRDRDLSRESSAAEDGATTGDDLQSATQSDHSDRVHHSRSSSAHAPAHHRHASTAISSSGSNGVADPNDVMFDVRLSRDASMDASLAGNAGVGNASEPRIGDGIESGPSIEAMEGNAPINPDVSSRSNSELGLATVITGERVQQPLVVKPYYTVWPGRHIMCCSGRCLAGPDLPVLICSLVLIFLPSLVWFFLVLPVVADETGLWIYVFSGLLVVGSILFLLLTAFSDPGIIPRQPRPRLRPGEQIPRFKVVTMGNETVKMKWCTTCNIYRPPRASHCSRCEACVMRFDHHCPWTGTDIGERNYRWFLLFVVCAATLCLTALVTSVACIQINTDKQNGSVSDGVGDSWGAMAVILFAVALFCFTGPLCCFHIYLTIFDVTTRENIKGRHGEGSFRRRSCLGNVAHVFCYPTPSLIRRGLRSLVPVTADGRPRGCIRHPYYSHFSFRDEVEDALAAARTTDVDEDSFV